MSTKRDYYEILGLSKGASDSEIKAAYKKLAKKFHPDISKEDNAEEKFKEILEAYSVLSDQQKKANYDQFGHAAEGFQGFGTGTGGFDFSGTEFDFDDLFSSFGFGNIFGSQRKKRGPRKGLDLRFDLSILFEEAAFGAKKEIEIERVEDCDKCNGTGSEEKDGLISCNQCNGTGMQSSAQRTPFGTFTTRTTCRKCNGEGKTVKNPCTKCNGIGRIKKERKITVSIPEGIQNGAYLRLSGEGNAGERGAGNGDLYVVIFIEPHEFFKRDEADIYGEVPITFSTAALGNEIEVPTLKGKAKLRLPAGTQTGTIFRLKGKGIKDIERSGFGDEYIKVILRTPEKMSGKQKKLLEELREEEKTTENGLMKKFKKMFK
ncbi:MAG: molecular chaperone DnaJ [archaeon]